MQKRLPGTFSSQLINRRSDYPVAAEQIVGRERRERLSQLAWCGEGCFDSRRRVNSTVRWLTTLMKHMLRCLGFFFGLILLSPNLCAQTPANRAAALRTLKGCATRPITQGCGLDTIDYLVGLYNHGDRSL